MAKGNTQSSRQSASTRIHTLIAQLRACHPDAKCSLNYTNPLELLIATILSAQCTDERVNLVTAELFRKYRNVTDYAQAHLPELEREIHSTGFYRNKAKNIQATAQRILEVYGGDVPESMAELLTLPGVARKTANVVLGNAYGIAVGVVVDTHVRRVSKRLGLTEHENPEKIERDLIEKIPKADWIDFSHLLIYHGRRICKPRPLCQNCPVATLCPARQQ
ncbi:MAG: endonuclease III [Acidobacteriota bacterium]